MGAEAQVSAETQMDAKELRGQMSKEQAADFLALLEKQNKKGKVEGKWEGALDELRTAVGEVFRNLNNQVEAYNSLLRLLPEDVRIPYSNLKVDSGVLESYAIKQVSLGNMAQVNEAINSEEEGIYPKIAAFRSELTKASDYLEKN